MWVPHIQRAAFFIFRAVGGKSATLKKDAENGANTPEEEDAMTFSQETSRHAGGPSMPRPRTL